MMYYLSSSHCLRPLLLDGRFLLGLVGGRRFSGGTGEEDQVVFGLRDLGENEAAVGTWSGRE